MTFAGETDPYARVRVEIEEASSFDRPFVVTNVLAAVVACYGLLVDSAAVVIGATILAMLLGPISGIALALVDGDARLLGRASLAVAGRVSVVLITAAIIGFVHKDVPVTHQILERTSPNFFELMIALAGGAAGAYASISPRLSIAFVGVALFQAGVARDLKQGLADYPGTFLADLRFTRSSRVDATIVQAVMRGPRELGAEDA